MRYTFKEDTIVALSTPLGNGAIAVVRLSGPSAFEIINRLINKKIKQDESHKAFFRTLQSVQDGSIIDQVVITLFKAPNSYTGEDVVEISSHCNPLIINKIINDSIFCGARIAEPGEFTFRAFMNNKMDLSQAESVADIIQARTNQSLNQSIRHLEGNYSQIIKDVRNEILDYLSLTEINLDFSDEEIEAIPLIELENKILSTIKRLKKLMETYDYGRLLHSGIKLLLIGKPNVGKSSLLNL
ncbi:MAG: tRNA modification GTPase, partial [Calditrichia bacterium]